MRQNEKIESPKALASLKMTAPFRKREGRLSLILTIDIMASLIYFPERSLDNSQIIPELIHKKPEQLNIEIRLPV